LVVITKDLLVLNRGENRHVLQSEFVIVENDLGQDLVDDNGKANDLAKKIATVALGNAAEDEGLKVISASGCAYGDLDAVEMVADDDVSYIDAGTVIADYDMIHYVSEMGFGISLEEIQDEAYTKYIDSLDENGQSGLNFADLKYNAAIKALKASDIGLECDQVVTQVMKSLLLQGRTEKAVKEVCSTEKASEVSN